MAREMLPVRLLVLSLCLLTCVASNTLGQGSYPPVTEKEVQALKFNHYFTADKKYHPADFQWSFTETEFLVKKGNGPISTELLETMLPAGTTAEEVRGKWKLEANPKSSGRTLVLTDIRAGDKAGKEEVRLAIYKTGGIVVRINAPQQHVFGIER